MKVQESLKQYRDDKFWNMLIEAEKKKKDFKPAKEFKKKAGDPEKEQAQKMQEEDAKIGETLINHLQKNFGQFKRSAGKGVEAMRGYKAFFQKQKSGLEQLQKKGPYKIAYIYYDAPKIIALKNIEGEISIDAIDIKNGDIAYTTTNKVTAKAFRNFMVEINKEMKEAKDDFVRTVDNKKKDEEQKVKKEKLQKFLKEESLKKN